MTDPLTIAGGIAVAADVVTLATGAASLIPQAGPSGIYYHLCTCQLDFLGTDSSAQDPQPQPASAVTNGSRTNRRASRASPADVDTSGPIKGVPILEIKSSKGNNNDAIWSIYGITAGNAVTATIRLSALNNADDFDMVYAVEFIATQYKHGAIFDIKGFVEKPPGKIQALSPSARAYFAGRCLVVHQRETRDNPSAVSAAPIRNDQMTITRSPLRLSQVPTYSGLQLTYSLP